VPLAATLGALALLALPASAQLAWDTPRLLGPNVPDGFGVHWLRAGALPGDGDALLVTWAPPGLPAGMSLRGGGGRGAGGDVAGFGGVDVSAPLTERRPGLPVDLSWNAGAGLGVGQWVLFSVPVGLSAGRAWSSGAVWIAPYVSAGLALDLRVGDEAPDKEFEVQPAADVGVDLSLDRARRVTLRAAASLGDRQAVAVGVLVRTGR
jgi:hypothetical protein